MITENQKDQLRSSVLDMAQISGATHNFYRYPARFSPTFASTAIKVFSKPGDVILDPHMGGGTTIVEGLLSGRRTIGSDINELAVFLAKAKTSLLSSGDIKALLYWSDKARTISVRDSTLDRELPSLKNLHIPRARWIKKTISILLEDIEGSFSSPELRDFARCVVLNAGQWALNGKRRAVSTVEFLARIQVTAREMLEGLSQLSSRLRNVGVDTHTPVLFRSDVDMVDAEISSRGLERADLVVTSPPYPGIHMLYHRWQVDGRKETDAPYWISGCTDGAGSAYYNYASREKNGERKYFEKCLTAYTSIRKAMKPSALLVQLIAFSRPESQLRMYLDTLSECGFIEVRRPGERRLWRKVPSRSWHATLKGDTPSSREVVLIHRAV